MHDKIVSKFALSLISVAVVLVVSDIALYLFTGLRNYDTTVFIYTTEGLGLCYSSNKNGYLPLNIKDSTADRDTIKRILIAPEMEDLETTPYCILYGNKKRKAGFFPEREKQAILIGDSFAFGQGLKDNDTLGYLLGLKYKNVNFHNFGRLGLNIDSIADAEQDALDSVKNAEAVIYFYNLNDVLPSGDLPSWQKLPSDLENIRWEGLPYGNAFFKELQKKSTIFSLARRTYELRKASKSATAKYLDMYFDKTNEAYLERTFKLIKLMDRTAKNYGARFYLVIYPLLYKDMLGNYPFKSIHGLLKDYCDRNGINCVDTYVPFEGYYSLKQFMVHPIDYHPNGKANRLVVNYLSAKGLNF